MKSFIEFLSQDYLHEAISYAQVHMSVAPGKVQKVYLRVTNDAAKSLAGYEVNKDGDEIVPRGHERRMRVIDKQTIKKIIPMRMDRTYGSLIAEKFFDGYAGHGYQGYTEVWINPTGLEVADASRKRQVQVDHSFHEAPAQTAYYCRGWLTDKHLFVWSADSDDHMNVEDAITQSARKNRISVNFSNALAVELWYFPSKRTVGLHMASWSNPHHLTDTQAVERAKHHPAIKSLLGPAGKLIPVDA